MSLFCGVILFLPHHKEIGIGIIPVKLNNMIFFSNVPNHFTCYLGLQIIAVEIISPAFRTEIHRFRISIKI